MGKTRKIAAVLVFDVVGYSRLGRGGRRSRLVAASATAERSHRSRRLTEQAIIGLTLLEKGRRLVNYKFSQADTMTAICYPGGTLLVLPNHVNAKNFPRLAPLTGRAMKIDAFAFTLTHP
jgi:hypothetical protein